MFVETNYNLQKFGSGLLPLLIQSAGTHEQEPIQRPQGFLFHQVIWVTDGTGMFTVGDQTVTLSAGEGFFMRRTVAHAYHTQTASFHTAWFCFWGCDSLLEHYGAGDAFRFELPAFFARQFAEFLALCRGNSTPISRSAAGYSLLCGLLAAHFSPAAPLTQRVDEFLESHFSRDVTLEEVAAMVGMSKYALCHRYKSEQGVSVMEQLRRIRVAKAKQYLTAGNYSIAEIGRLCGFADASYFTRSFREQTGRTPREYRQKQS